jgi:hypothetical protein
VKSIVGLDFTGSFLSRHTTMKDQSPNIIDETARFWTKRAGRVISQEEARQALENVAGFFRVLQEWDEADCRTRFDDGVSASAKVNGGAP